VVPRIADIPLEIDRIRVLVPDAKVMVAHGEMPNVEEAIERFVMKEANVLVATTLVGEASNDHHHSNYHHHHHHHLHHH